jgi:segregation and condensation protein B
VAQAFSLCEFSQAKSLGQLNAGSLRTDFALGLRRSQAFAMIRASGRALLDCGRWSTAETGWRGQSFRVVRELPAQETSEPGPEFFTRTVIAGALERRRPDNARTRRKERPLMDASRDRTEADGAASPDPDWTCEQIDLLYQQALDTVDSVASDLSSAAEVLSTQDASEEDHPSAEPGDHSAVVAESSGAAPASEPSAGSSPTVEGGRVTPAQVIEAILFVGGQPLTAKAICSALRGDFDADFVERSVDEINRRYSAQNRPYEVRLGDGGYRIILHSEFEPLRNRVYGFGPKHVRLSQDTLEILALIAYRQPISRHEIEETGKRSAGSHLRQLLQRELLVIERGEGEPGNEVRYRTSPRFLQLFGLARVEELPQIEDLNFK